jgi:hypothetical protein
MVLAFAALVQTVGSLRAPPAPAPAALVPPPPAPAPPALAPPELAPLVPATAPAAPAVPVPALAPPLPAPAEIAAVPALPLTAPPTAEPALPVGAAPADAPAVPADPPLWLEASPQAERTPHKRLKIAGKPRERSMVGGFTNQVAKVGSSNPSVDFP